MKLEKKEYGSWGDGRLVKTIAITLIPEDEADETILRQRGKKEGDTIYVSEHP